MVNHKGFMEKSLNQGKAGGPSAAAQNGQPSGTSAKKKVDPMHRKPRKSPKGPGISTKG